MDKEYWDKEYVKTARGILTSIATGGYVSRIGCNWEKAIDLSARMSRLFIERMKQETGEKENAPE